MGLIELQNAMARLFTDERYQQQLVNDPLSTGAESGLTAEEIESLMTLAKEAIPAFSHSLLRKRFGEVRRLLPASSAILGAKNWPLFRDFAANHPTTGCHRHRQDAIEFADSLLRHDNDALQRDILRFEREDLDIWNSGYSFRWLYFRHDLISAISRIRSGETDIQYVGRPTLAIWIRLGRNRRVFYRELQPRFWPSTSIATA